MDFRDRFPDIRYWPREAMDKCDMPFPYNKMPTGHLFEIPAPDDSTSFLCVTHFAEPVGGGGGQFFCYGVEAPPDYPIRFQFEQGLLTWTEFMSHRNWLVELTSVLFDQGPENARYVTPADIHPACKRKLQEFDEEGGPLHILYQHLLRSYHIQKNWPVKYWNREQEYFEFLAKYGELLGLTHKEAA